MIKGEVEDYELSPDDEPVFPVNHNRRWVVLGVVAVIVVLALGLSALLMTM